MKSYLELFPEDRSKVAGESHILLMTAPSIVQTAEDFDLKLTMMELSGMPDEDFTGLIRLAPSDESLEAPEKVRFTNGDKGRIIVPGLKALEAGAYFIHGEVEGSPSPGVRSNPILVKDRVRERLYWGDIHVHSVYSNCHPDYAKTPAFGYWYAREVSHLDFCSITDHLRGLTPERWRHLKKLADDFDKEGVFTTLLGFESSHSRECGGDINVYFSTSEADYFWLDREDMKSTRPMIPLETLYQWLRDRGWPHLLVPHHTGRAGKFRDFELPYYGGDDEPLLELFSAWGSSEARHDGMYLKDGKADSKSYLQDALALGYRYGVIASSDTHHAIPGCPVSCLPRPYHHPPNKLTNQGLAAVFARKLSRENIFWSLRSRRCYATTSTRPIIEFELNGVQMGGTVRENFSTRVLNLSIYTTVYPADVEIVRNNQVIHKSHIGDRIQNSFTFRDEEDPSRLWITDAPKSSRPFFYYYVRITFLGNHAGIRAWSSPIWVERGKPNA